jgi:hypothetical protein
VGGRLRVPLDRLPETSTVELWFWSGLPDADPLAGGRARVGGMSIAPRAWHHLARVQTPRNVKVSLDGQPVLSSTAGAAPTGGPAWTFLAIGNEGGPGFEGQIDELAFYDRALDDSEIAAHFRAATGH